MLEQVLWKWDALPHTYQLGLGKRERDAGIWKISSAEVEFLPPYHYQKFINLVESCNKPNVLYDTATDSKKLQKLLR